VRSSGCNGCGNSPLKGDDRENVLNGNVMTGFLDDMARSSAARVAEAIRHESVDALERRARRAAPSAPLRLSASGFDVIAELKLRSPAAGQLSRESEDWLGRVAAYARGGAAAVSVLTEPSRFDGSLDHLRRAAAVLAPLGVPAMRKDFLVDPYQVLEARAAGAGGVLVILRMLTRSRIDQLLDVAAEHGMFVLLEAFDAEDLAMARDLKAARAVRRAGSAEGGGEFANHGEIANGGEMILMGVNCRDLQTLKVVQERFTSLAPLLPDGWPAVAESGVASSLDARRMQQLGYRLALIGTALMESGDPSQLLRHIFVATRTVQP
jgi:indole-3-glycerol phosphate synthase